MYFLHGHNVLPCSGIKQQFKTSQYISPADDSGDSWRQRHQQLWAILSLCQSLERFSKQWTYCAGFASCTLTYAHTYIYQRWNVMSPNSNCLCVRCGVIFQSRSHFWSRRYVNHMARLSLTHRINMEQEMTMKSSYIKYEIEHRCNKYCIYVVWLSGYTVFYHNTLCKTSPL